MNVPLWVVQSASAFWRVAGEPGPFPRDLRAAIQLALPLSVQPVRALSVGVLRDWLRRRQIAHAVPGPDRSLRACILARGGGGFLFLAADDDAAEQRFSPSHELAHFLC